MIIYPDLELRKGRLVNLARNRIDSPIIYDLDPIQAARDLAAQGAEWLHVVDLDAVFNDGENTAIIKDIISKASCPVQVGGAIRSRRFQSSTPPEADSPAALDRRPRCDR